jgi:hypothetical protein
MCEECDSGMSTYAVHGREIPEGWELVPPGVKITTRMLCRTQRWVGWERVIKGGLAGLKPEEVVNWLVIRKVKKTKRPVKARVTDIPKGMRVPEGWEILTGAQVVKHGMYARGPFDKNWSLLDEVDEAKEWLLDRTADHLLRSGIMVIRKIKK